MNYPCKNMPIQEPLSNLRPGEAALIEDISGPELVAERLRELGLIEGVCITLLHEAPFGRNPIVVQVRGGKLALRRQEAHFIAVRRVEKL